MNHEEAVIKAFILPQRRDRYLEFISNQRNPASLVKLLTSKGAGLKCWVISEDYRLDGQEMELEHALRETIGYGMGTIISCIPGKLAYFEDEDVRYILQR